MAVMCEFDYTNCNSGSACDVTCSKCGRRISARVLPVYSPCSAKDEVAIAEGRRSPSLLQKLGNFAAATANHIAEGMPIASDEEIGRRHAICKACEFLKDGKCMQCGCPIERNRGYLSKLSWADQECPLGKWGKATKPAIDQP